MKLKLYEATKLISGIAEGLKVISGPAAAGLTTLCAGLQPFSDQTIEQFVDFLRQCDEYKRTGTVTTGKRGAAPKAKGSTLSAADAAKRVKELLAEINRDTVTTSSIESLVNDLNGLRKAELDQLLVTLLIAGKAKTKAHAVEMIRQVLKNQLEMHVKSRAV